ncbi:MAG: hypothetical protein QNI84_06830 [Henriciella sp.]|nr:hypothetical protein [Henriciella sp.]
MLNADLIATLGQLSAFLDHTEDPWWVLGSAAVALKGYNPQGVRDVDVLVSERDAEALIKRWGIRNQRDGGTATYRSRYFLLPKLGALRVEIMAGYEIVCDDTWQAVQPTSRTRIDVEGMPVFVPSDEDLISLFQMLGREKDLMRISAMRQR